LGSDDAYRLLQLALLLRRAGNWTFLLLVRLSVLAGTETSISFLFFLTTPLFRAVMSGELHFPVRSNQPQCWFLLVAQICPTVMPTRSPRHRDLRLRCIARINVYRSKDRAKDASSISHRRQAFDLRSTWSAYTLWCTLDERSPPRRPSDIRCHRRAVTAGGYPLRSTDRPRPSFQQHPAKSIAFQKTRMPFTATTREGACLGLLVFRHTSRPIALLGCAPSRRLSRSRRPHFFPRLGTVFLIGHCEVTVRSPAGP
jgi:hypothetical protein